MGFHEFAVNKFCGMVNKIDTKRLKAQSPPSGVECAFDVLYGSDKLYNLLDVYYPEGKLNEKLPVIIDVHGGAWYYGTKDINKYYCMEIAAKGYKVVNISYRLLLKGGVFPNNLSDLFYAQEWVYKNADKFGFDLNNAYIVGDSAGAHLAAMVLAVKCDEKLKSELGFDSKIDFKAAGFICGVFDIEYYRKRLKIPAVRFFLKSFFGNDYKSNKFVPYATIKNCKVESFPPVFMATGEKDFMRGQVLSFKQVLDDRGVENELCDLKSKKHKLNHVYPVIFPLWEESEFVTNNMLEFFKSYGV